MITGGEFGCLAVITIAMCVIFTVVVNAFF